MQSLDAAAERLEFVGWLDLATRLDTISLQAALEEDVEWDTKEKYDRSKKFFELPDFNKLPTDVSLRAKALNDKIQDAQRMSAILFQYAAETDTKQMLTPMQKQMRMIVAGRMSLFQMLKDYSDRPEDDQNKFKEALKEMNIKYDKINQGLREDVSNTIDIHRQALEEGIGPPKMEKKAQALLLVAEILLERGFSDLAGDILVLAEDEKMPVNIKRKLKKRKKIWLDCTTPTLEKGRRSKKKMWFSTCRYKKQGGGKGSMKRIVGKDPKKRQREVFIHDKKMKLRKPTLDEIESQGKERSLDKDVFSDDEVQDLKKDIKKLDSKKPLEKLTKEVKKKKELPSREKPLDPKVIEKESSADLNKDKAELDNEAEKPVNEEDERWAQDNFMENAKKTGKFDKFFLEETTRRRGPGEELPNPDEIEEKFINNNKETIRYAARGRRAKALDDKTQDMFVEWAQKNPGRRKSFERLQERYTAAYQRKYKRDPTDKEVNDNYVLENYGAYRTYRNQRNGVWGKMKFKMSGITTAIARHPGLTKAALAIGLSAWKIKKGDPLGALSAITLHGKKDDMFGHPASTAATAIGVSAALLSNDKTLALGQFDSVTESAAEWSVMNVVPTDMRWMYYGTDAIANPKDYEPLTPLSDELASTSSWLDSHRHITSFIPGLGI